MKVKVIEEAGYKSAMLGLSLNKKQDPNNMPRVAELLAHAKGGGHGKVIESINVWLDITAPRYFWSEFDTYRVGITKQSESTMHTIHKDIIDESCFEGCVDPRILEILKEYQKLYQDGLCDVQSIKSVIPESWLQRRVVSTNYKTLQNIYHQRKNHKLPIWKDFCKDLLNQLEHPELIVKDKKMTLTKEHFENIEKQICTHGITKLDDKTKLKWRAEKRINGKRTITLFKDDSSFTHNVSLIDSQYIEHGLSDYYVDRLINLSKKVSNV